MLPPIIDVRVLSSVVLTLSVVAVAVAAPEDTTVAMPLAFANVSVVDKLYPVLVLLLDIVDVGAIGAPSDDKISVVVLSVVVLSSILVVVVAIVLVVPLLFAGFRDAV